MSLKKQIETDFITAYKAGETLKKNTLGILKSRFSEWKANKQNAGKELTDADVLDILSSEVKKRNQAIEIYKTNFSADAIEKQVEEEYEKKILSTYLPQQMTEIEIREQIEIVEQTTEASKL